MARILRLDRMEILGFKSFYGRTRFDFPDGITAVVGPNGCGKSNIGDAISWVLGEQRASSLRSDRMEDVIFNGSEGRRPLGMAEVSLHFKNILMEGNGRTGGNGHGNGHDAGNGHGGGNGHDRDLEVALTPQAPEPARDDHEVPIPAAVEGEFPPAGLAVTGIEEIPEEVVVTRRIYRSGESEYILNGQRCRLKDILDLLAKTDIGSRLYSTIEQGKIDQILAARPKDRRAMFEEAAGILGYKGKRRQAELKLEAAHANLLRINDIVVEVEKQIQALRRQAAKARRYQRLVESLREKRLALSQRRLHDLDADRGATVAAIEALRAEEAAASSGLAAGEADLERLRLQLEEGEAAGRRRREEIHAIDLEIDRIQERVRSGQEQGRDLETRLAEAGRELISLAGRLSEREAGLAAVMAEIAAEESRGREAAAANQGGEADDDRAREILVREADLEAARGRLLGEIEAIAATTRRRATLEEQVRLARASREEIGREKAELRASRQTLGDEVAARERRSAEGAARARAAAAEHEASVAAGREATARLAAAERRADEQKGRAGALAERLAALEELERQRAGFSEGVGDILKGSGGITPRGVVGDCLEVPRGLEKAIEATLGDLLEGVLVDGDAAAARGIGYLRSTARGRVSFVPGEGAASPAGESGSGAIPPRPGLMGRLADRIAGVPPGPIARILSRTFLVEDLDRALELGRTHPGFAYVTPQGDIVRLDGAVTGGDGRALQHWLLARRAEREEIARQMSEVAAARENDEGDLMRLRRELAAAENRLEAAAAGVQEGSRAAFESDLNLQQARSGLDRIDRALPLLLAEQARLEREIAAGGSETERLAGGLLIAEAGRRATEEAIQTASAALAVRRTELDRVRRESAEARAVLLAGEARLGSARREKEGLEETLLDLKTTLGRRTAERDEWTVRAAQIRDQEAVMERQRQAGLAARAEAAARDEAAHAGLAYERSLAHAREQSVKEGRAAHGALREKQQERELHLARIEADFAHLERSCRDELATTVEDLRAAPAPADDGLTLQEREAEVQRIRAEIESAGAVNLMAVEQQKDLEERFSFLTAQKTDLEQAIASLRETIRTINREARERFRSAFEAIQGHFQVCFTTLFGGGKAELRLSDDEEDVLEAGVEIVAQPPGKRLQKIALLSGGEKALTAVALLMSLFRYRPSPFCILDEVDAPLDEANIERFTRLLQELRTDTQFILITHNRKSMEAADLLYGVTMEEPGVSKILPLRFE
ncbi:MAG: chromosome segregation protein SMC [Acidobacteria bacterium]|nr:chromosome segregation protein SMC [Acidobacteriota bacterium]